MKFLENVKDSIIHPLNIFYFLDKKGILRINDKLYLNIQFRRTINKKLNLKNPQTFNEKIQWLKINNKNPEYTNMVDKYEVKKYVASKIGEEYIIPTLGIYNKFDDIDFNKLPNQFVIKCTHDSGGLIICKDKSNFDLKEAKQKIEKCLKQNYFWNGREWPYKNVKPRIIIEKYMIDESTNDLNDYKFFCFNGKPEMILVCSKRFSSTNMCKTFFDINWQLLELIEGEHPVDKCLKKPKNLELMNKLACRLSNKIPFLRVDFYEINGKVYFGELTFFPNGGYEKFKPNEWDNKLGNKINLNGV